MYKYIKKIIKKYNDTPLALRIFIGIVIGVILAGVCSNISSAVSEENAKNIIDSIGIVSIFGTCFIAVHRRLLQFWYFFWCWIQLSEERPVLIPDSPKLSYCILLQQFWRHFLPSA